MQKSFDFGLRTDLEFILHRLRPALAGLEYHPRLEPAWQMVLAILGSREKDEKSWAALRRLRDRFPRLEDLASASLEEIKAQIADINLADRKAEHIVSAMAFLAGRNDTFDIGLLKQWPAHRAHAWLASIKGVGPKIAASTLNFSTLGVAALVVDTHVQRVLKRLGCMDPRADIDKVYRIVMGVTEGWFAQDYEDLHMELRLIGQAYCTDPLAKCRECPLDAICKHVVLPRKQSNRNKTN